MLGTIQRIVGFAQQFFAIGGVLRVRREADAHGEPAFGDTLIVAETVLPHRVAHVLGGDIRPSRAGLGKHDRELLAAVAAHHIDLSDSAAEYAAQLGQRHVARGMAELVVELLELVGVDHQQRYVVDVAASPLDLLAESLLQVAVVVETREPVGHRQPPGELVEPRVLHGYHQLAGDADRISTSSGSSRTASSPGAQKMTWRSWWSCTGTHDMSDSSPASACARRRRARRLASRG